MSLKRGTDGKWRTNPFAEGATTREIITDIVVTHVYSILIFSLIYWLVNHFSAERLPLLPAIGLYVIIAYIVARAR